MPDPSKPRSKPTLGGIAALIGGLGAGAGVVALALRGRWRGGSAHQPDGTDSSDEFEAGIADKNIIPDRMPGDVPPATQNRRIESSASANAGIADENSMPSQRST